MDNNTDWLEGADDDEIRWRCAMKKKWDDMMREARLHAMERPDTGPPNAYGEEENDRVLARLEEEEFMAARREEALEMERIGREAEKGPPEVSVAVVTEKEDAVVTEKQD
jgi:hypothetical protein